MALASARLGAGQESLASRSCNGQEGQPVPELVAPPGNRSSAYRGT